MRKNKIMKKRITWTVQPEKAVVELSELVLGKAKNKKGQRTKLVNDAMKAAYPKEWAKILQRRKAEIDREIEALKSDRPATPR